MRASSTNPFIYIWLATWEATMTAGEKLSVIGSAIGIVKTAVDIYVVIDDRRKKRDAEREVFEKRVADLESQLARLKEVSPC